ncbi:MAG: hypothetical protein SP1CHLAM54_07950 [Chlamydiia bacterium]|nr:hypothetical protein [Chlamydiia bacterium]MCH9615701.1 hypothetical protein [Chlamydiia bacterium]MCH9628896.1 hypothetical protein [Chlamydiia bacterium]
MKLDGFIVLGNQTACRVTPSNEHVSFIPSCLVERIGRDLTKKLSNFEFPIACLAQMQGNLITLSGRTYQVWGADPKARIRTLIAHHDHFCVEVPPLADSDELPTVKLRGEVTTRSHQGTLLVDDTHYVPSQDALGTYRMKHSSGRVYQLEYQLGKTLEVALFQLAHVKAEDSINRLALANLRSRMDVRDYLDYGVLACLIILIGVNIYSFVEPD